MSEPRRLGSQRFVSGGRQAWLSSSTSRARSTSRLEEYRSLRDEAKQRVSERVTLLGLLTAAAAVIAATHDAVWAYVVAAAFLMIGALVWLRSSRILDKLSRRIAALEKAINDLAEDRLLTRCTVGAAAVGDPATNRPRPARGCRPEGGVREAVHPKPATACSGERDRGSPPDD